MTKKEKKDAIRFSYQKYRREFDKRMEKGQIREGIVRMNLKEYEGMYNKYAVLATGLEDMGKETPIHELIISDSSAIEERVIRAIQRILAEHGIKTSLDVVRDNQARYFNMIKQWYPDDEAYDMALSSHFGW